MSDYIKREDAIEKATELVLGCITSSRITNEAKGIVKTEFYKLPSADVVERKRGEWILTPYTDCGAPVYECSVCTHGVSGDLQVRNFCPNCGASMRGAE